MLHIQAKSAGHLCSMKKITYLLMTGIIITGLLSFTDKEKQTQELHTVNGLAIGGYDAVAYFTRHQAVKGDSTIQLKWSGATWYFASRENKKLFEENPAQYAPQYGGYCAYGASKGYKAQTDPTAWTIVGGKLYLNYNAKVKTVWLPDTTNRIQAANQYWESLSIKNN